MSDIPLESGAIARPAPTRAYRWIVLLAMSVALYGSYYAFDYIGPLAPLLSRQLHFPDSRRGTCRRRRRRSLSGWSRSSRWSARRSSATWSIATQGARSS